MSDVHAEEDEALQLGQVVVAELEVVNDDGRLPLEDGHGSRDVEHICELTEDVQTVLLDGALAGGDLRVRGALVVALGGHCSSPPYQRQPDQPHTACLGHPTAPRLKHNKGNHVIKH